MSLFVCTRVYLVLLVRMELLAPVDTRATVVVQVPEVILARTVSLDLAVLLESQVHLVLYAS